MDTVMNIMFIILIVCVYLYVYIYIHVYVYIYITYIMCIKHIPYSISCMVDALDLMRSNHDLDCYRGCSKPAAQSVRS